MKAAVYTRYGPPEMLAIQDIETPVPSNNEVLIKVHATTVNRTDCGFLRAKPWLVRLIGGVRRPKRQTLGNEFAGKVVAVGEQVSAFNVGDDVFGYNDATFGAHAECMAMPADGMMAVMPSGLSYEAAAPTAEGAHYALAGLRKTGVAPGQRLLINGATGAIGSAAVQLAKHMGAEITATCRAEHALLVTSLGADRVIDYTTEDFTQVGREFDVVFDAVGKSTFGACKKLLKPGGIYCSTELGPKWQNPFLALWTTRFGEHQVIFPFPSTSQADMEFLKQLIESDAFKPVVDRTFSLDQITEAFTYVESGQKVGNVVIAVEPAGET